MLPKILMTALVAIPGSLFLQSLVENPSIWQAFGASFISVGITWAAID